MLFARYTDRRTLQKRIFVKSLLLILSLTFLTAKCWGQSCVESLQDWTPPVWLGEGESENDHEAPRFLGEGIMGGRVYLVERGNDKVLVKKFKRKESLDNDIQAWSLLQGLLGDDPRYLIPQFRRIDDFTLEMEYIPTMDLKKLIEKENETPRVQHWKRLYHEVVQALNAEVIKANLYHSLRPNYLVGLPMYEAKKYHAPGNSTNLLLKPDNVAPVPGNRHQLLIFDPY